VTAKLGEQATGQGFALTVHEVRDPVPPQRYRQPKEGTRWIAVDVTVRNIGTAELSYNPFYAKLKAADNREYSATVGVAEPDLGAGKQQPGDATRGWITFELPADTQPALLVYTPDFGRNRVQFDLRP
jgi:hypothetical protein